jgi:hypothetical protein
MPVYLVPAMIRVEANALDAANALACDYIASGRGDTECVTVYLDEALPTVEIPAVQWPEFPHSMLEEEVCGLLFLREGN